MVFMFCELKWFKNSIMITLVPLMYTYACNLLETLNQKISLNVTLKLSKVNHSSKNLGMFQLVSTYDIA